MRGISTGVLYRFAPLTPFVEQIGLGVFGTWLVGLRLFSVIAQALVVVVAGLMARELGGLYVGFAAHF